MTLHRKYDGELIDLDDYERKTYLEKSLDEDGAVKQIPKEEVEYVFECDHCGEMKEYTEVTPIGAGISGHVCREHIDDEVLEAVEENE